MTAPLDTSINAVFTDYIGPKFRVARRCVINPRFRRRILVAAAHLPFATAMTSPIYERFAASESSSEALERDAARGDPLTASMNVLCSDILAVTPYRIMIRAAQLYSAQLLQSALMKT